jgi:hypothetical protein
MGITSAEQGVIDLIEAHSEWAKRKARWLARRDRRVRKLGADEAEGEALYALWQAA